MLKVTRTVIDGKPVLAAEDTTYAHRTAPPAQPTCPAWIKSYQPRTSDVEWLRNLITVMADGGVWTVPATGACYALDKSAKTLTLIGGPVDDWFWQTSVVAERIGYKTVVATVNASAGSGKTSVTGRQ